MRQPLPGALREIPGRQRTQEHPDLGQHRRVRLRHPQPVPDRHPGRTGHHERRRHLPHPPTPLPPPCTKIPITAVNEHHPQRSPIRPTNSRSLPSKLVHALRAGQGSIQLRTGCALAAPRSRTSPAAGPGSTAVPCAAAPSRPASPTAAQAMVRFCGEIILPRTPPELLAAASRSGGESRLAGGGHLEGAEEGVGRGVRSGHGDPNQPRTGERNASPAPAAATKWPIVAAWPERFIDIGERQYGGHRQDREAQLVDRRRAIR